MEFPYYGHLVFWFWFDIFLGTFWGWFWLDRLYHRLQKGWSYSVGNWLYLFWFIFWLPHSSYLFFEFFKHWIGADGVLEPLTTEGILTYGGLSFLGLASCVCQISIAVGAWRKYGGRAIFPVKVMIISGASFGTLLGLCGVNFYHIVTDPSHVWTVMRQITALKTVSDPFGLGAQWPMLIGGLLFLGLWALNAIFGKYISGN